MTRRLTRGLRGSRRRVEENLAGQLSRLLVYPQVEVILTDYYNPTNASGAFWEVVNLRCLLVDVYDRSEHVVHTLNAAITQAWHRLGSPSSVQVATVHDAFHGHEAPRPWCGTAPRTPRRRGFSTPRIPTRMPPRSVAIASMRTVPVLNSLPRP